MEDGMGAFDKFKDKADQLKDKVGGERIDKGVEKAGDAVDQRTGGKYAEQVDKAQEAASERYGQGAGGGEPGSEGERR
ncbi:antitoxin [Allostreptomyces psammosilenae]|nr:antitoxin [Allostreptomyces psammosilenae]